MWKLMAKLLQALGLVAADKIGNAVNQPKPAPKVKPRPPIPRRRR